MERVSKVGKFKKKAKVFKDLYKKNFNVAEGKNVNTDQVGPMQEFTQLNNLLISIVKKN